MVLVPAVVLVRVAAQVREPALVPVADRAQALAQVRVRVRAQVQVRVREVVPADRGAVVRRRRARSTGCT